MKIIGKLMFCGGCGCKDFNIFGSPDTSMPNTLIAQCTTCVNNTLIRPQATLSLDWTKGSDGRLAPCGDETVVVEEQ
jgi:hypothetical protein